MSLFIDYLVRRAPAWLQRERGEAFLSAIGMYLDAIADSFKEATLSHFPERASPSAQNAIGADRQSPRSTVLGYETSPSYGARLRRLWEDQLDRGNKTGILEILRVIGATAPSPWTYSVYDLDEWNPWAPWNWGWILLQQPHPWASDGAWGDPGVWGDGGTWSSNATVSEVRNYKAVVKPWLGAHTRFTTIVHLDGGVWGEPGTWADPGTWGGHVAQWPMT